MIPILKDTTLCAIVRDEVMNPAGGIRRFVESHLPFVERAVIVDTGSIDGTRDCLSDLEKVNRNLEVYDVEFKGYPDARNFSLSKVKTKYCLVLDADELLTDYVFEKLKILMNRKKALAYNFNFLGIFPCGTTRWGNGHNPRLFNMDLEPEYDIPIGLKGEFLFRRVEQLRIVDRGVANLPLAFKTNQVILHFVPSLSALNIKSSELYARNLPQPSKLPNFSCWKAYNPMREEYL